MPCLRLVDMTVDAMSKLGVSSMSFGPASFRARRTGAALGVFLAVLLVASPVAADSSFPASAKVSPNTITTVFGTYKVYRLAEAVPGAIYSFYGSAQDASGNLWLAADSSFTGNLWRVTPDGAATVYDMRSDQVAIAPDGTVWYANEPGRQVGYLKSDGTTTEFPLPGFPDGMAFGPDGNLWVLEWSTHAIARVTPSGQVTEYPAPYAGLSPEPGVAMEDKIAAGAEGDLWFDAGVDRVSRISLTGEVTDFLLPTSGSVPTDIVLGTDGNMWFPEVSGNAIGRVTPTGEIKEFHLPEPALYPYRMKASPNGDLWFSYGNVGNSGLGIGRMTTSGDVELFPAPQEIRQIASLAGATDSSVWFVGSKGYLGQFTLRPAVDVPAQGLFDDLTGYDWAATAIQELGAQGIIKGVATRVFAPSAAVTRGQFAALLQRLFDLSMPANPARFSDVIATDWYYQAVEAVAPFLPGAEGGRFRPSDPVTREQVAAALVRLLSQQGLVDSSSCQVDAVLAPFGDASAIAPGLRTDVGTAIASHLMRGPPGGTFNPRGTLTRAEAAVALYRLEH